MGVWGADKLSPEGLCPSVGFDVCAMEAGEEQSK